MVVLLQIVMSYGQNSIGKNTAWRL